MRAYGRIIAYQGALVFAIGGDKGGNRRVINNADGGGGIFGKDFFIEKFGNFNTFGAGRNFCAKKILGGLDYGYTDEEKHT